MILLCSQSRNIGSGLTQERKTHTQTQYNTTTKHMTAINQRSLKFLTVIPVVLSLHSHTITIIG